MSYDLALCNPIGGQTLTVPPHSMYGVNVPCRYEDGRLIPDTKTDAELGITYNYAHYFYEVMQATNGDDGRLGRGGIYTIDGMSGADAIPLLKQAIADLERKYKDDEGRWIRTTRKRLVIFNRKTGERCSATAKLDMYFDLRRRGVEEVEVSKRLEETYRTEEEIVEVNEGGGEDDYWLDTAANAIRALHQVLALSKMRPDGVWRVE